MHTVANKLVCAALCISLALAGKNAASAECEDPQNCSDPAQLEALAIALQGYREAVVLGELAEAELLAKRAVELSIAVNDRDSVHTANALTNLAYVQYRQEQFEPARLNLLAAIQTIEDIGDNLSADLIQPLHRLGQTELALGEVDGATASFQRAVHISHVHSGPQNIEQIESLEEIAEIYLLSDNIKDARNTQRRILAYRARADGPESAEYLPALKHYAEWMRRLRLFNSETNTYLDMLDLQERHYGEDDLQLIPTLVRLTLSLHDGSRSPLDDNGVRHMRSPDYYVNRAMKIAEENSQSDWETYADTALTIGDYYTMAQRFGRARSAYRKAWQQLSITPAGLARRSEEMESPKRLAAPRLPRYFEDQDPLYDPDPADEFLPGTIVAEFGVTKTGESVYIELVESQPPGLTKIEDRLVRSLRSLMHRPAMQDGAMISTENMSFVYEFFYRENESQE